MAVATSYNVTATQGARESLANTLRFVEPTTTPLYSTLAHSAAPKAVSNDFRSSGRKFDFRLQGEKSSGTETLARIRYRLRRISAHRLRISHG